MQVLEKQPTVKAPAETFTGDASFDVIARGEEPSRIRVSVVRFAPGARNAWHAHSVGQTVHGQDVGAVPHDDNGSNGPMPKRAGSPATWIESDRLPRG